MKFTGDAQTILADCTKACSRCREIKPFSEFARASKERSGYQSACKACRKALYWPSEKVRRKVRYSEDESYRLRQQGLVNAAFKKYGDRYKQKLLDRYHANSDVRRSVIDRVNAWRLENPQKTRVYSARKRAGFVGAEGDFSAADVERLLYKQQSRCIYCGSDISDGLHTIEHLTPLSRGGSNWVENIALACRSCNGRKGDKLVTEFIKV